MIGNKIIQDEYKFKKILDTGLFAFYQIFFYSNINYY